MAANNHEDNSKQASDNHVPNAENILTSNIHTDDASNQGVRSRQRNRKQTPKPKKVIVEVTSIPEQRDSYGTKSNIISIVSAVLNFGLVICTIILAGIAINQAKSADSAATTAQQTFTETKNLIAQPL